jgi:hypothetical protein
MGERTIWVVVNAASGSNDGDSESRLVADLARAGHAPARIVRLPDDDLPGADDLHAARVDLLVMFTGDGTANAQIGKLGNWAGEMLVLPGGTQNLLSRQLHGDRTADQIIALLGQGVLVQRRLPMIRSVHGDALCEVLAGPGAMWSDVRETLRDGDVAGVASTLAEAIRQSANGPPVVLADPALGRSGGYPAVRLHPAGEAMTVDGYGGEGFVDFARQGAAILMRDFRQGPHDELGPHAAVTCRSDAPIELMLDGERVTGSRQERFEIAPCPLCFLASPV